ncbi:MAG TPA: Flp family type IVb pilin [Marmoricola sp.]|nr:Flp family type IVb pilin [Marmoricola sp.]HNI69866.1 Flp family type IVb pilin [Marmoricola sp.]HNJ78925.1 Flp family type IVb pilin [Marmoricola sp.]HNN48509.1 Flp family type IVb pilin [Marmoricola sp.]HNO39185.1 Flp family type IVb pilin [Marmoricola sp.]
MTKLYVRFQMLRNEKGATAVEYGLMIALIAAVIIAAVTLLGGNLNGIFEDVADAVPAGTGGAP